MLEGRGMISKKDWVLVACDILVESGSDGLTIEALAGRLGVTKGSFYHHFKNYDGFKRAFLEAYEEFGTSYVIEQAETTESAYSKMEVVLEATLTEPREVEVALRAWALRDSLVMEYQQRIDARRLDYIRQLYRQLVADEAKANRLAQLIYIAYVGSQHIRPPMSPEQLRQIYLEILQLYRHS